MDHAILELYRADILTVTRIPNVMERWDNPPHDWGKKTAWRLFNCVTHTLEGRIAENPGTTRRLHAVVTSVCINGQLALAV